MSQVALHPLIHVNESRLVDCMLCGRRCDPKDPNVYSNQSNTFPRMYFHARPCAVGLTGEELQAIYLREVERELRKGAMFPLRRIG